MKGSFYPPKDCNPQVKNLLSWSLVGGVSLKLLFCCNFLLA